MTIFPLPYDDAWQRTIFYFNITSGIRNIKCSQLQAIYPMYYITSTKMNCKLISEMSLVRLLKWSSLLLKNSTTYWWNSMTFHDQSHFPWLFRPGNSFLKFHDFPWLSRMLWNPGVGKQKRKHKGKVKGGGGKSRVPTCWRNLNDWWCHTQRCMCFGLLDASGYTHFHCKHLTSS